MYIEGQAPTVRYDGAYVDGVRQGIGKLSLPNGDKYHGKYSYEAYPEQEKKVDFFFQFNVTF